MAPAASLLTGCAKEVVVEPIAPRKVAGALMAYPSVPRCALPARADYAPGEIVAYAACWQAAYDALFVKHKGLIRAVAQRERTAAKAIKAAKQ